MLAHPTGIAEIYLGEVTGTKIEMATDVVARTASAKEVTRRPPALRPRSGADLAYAYDMAAVGQPLQPHLSAQLKRTVRPEPPTGCAACRQRPHAARTGERRKMPRKGGRSPRGAAGMGIGGETKTPGK